MALQGTPLTQTACPTCGETTTRQVNTNFLLCERCRRQFCTECHLTAHPQLTCAASLPFATMRPVFKRLFVAAFRFFQDTRGGHLNNQPHVQFNTHLLRPSTAWTLFERALVEVVGSNYDTVDVTSFGRFFWHGTSLTGVRGICDGGFDPAFRKNQGYGPGDYFSLFVNVSKGYVKGDNTLLVVFALEKFVTVTKDANVHIVNNPTDRSKLFCLPILVITYDGKPLISDFGTYDFAGFDDVRC